MGVHLCIDETMLGGHLYTIVSNRDAHGKRGTIVAIIKGVKSEVIIKALEKIPKELRDKVVDITMDFSDSMKLIAEKSFPKATITVDHFHIIQDLYNHMLESLQDEKKQTMIAIKHERAEWRKLCENASKRRRYNREKYPRNHKGRKRGRKPVILMKNFKTQIQIGNEAKLDFLRRALHTLRTGHEKWSDEQQARMNMLFNACPAIKEAFDLAMEFRDMFRIATPKGKKYADLTKEEKLAYYNRAKEQLASWYEKVAKCNSTGLKTFKRTIKEREKHVMNYFLTGASNAPAESLNSRIKAFRADLKGTKNIEKFLYRVCKIYG